MTIFIVILISISLLGSILWIKPSEREQQQMQLRLMARKKALVVQFTHIELPDKWDKSKTKLKVMSYNKFRVKKAPSFTMDVNFYPYEVWKHYLIAEGWYANTPVNLSKKAKDTLSGNLKRFTAIKISTDSVSLYWQEEGEECLVDEINNLLIELEQLS